MTKNIKIRSILASYSQIPVIKLQVALPNTSTSPILQVPPDELPLYGSQAEAGVKLFHEVWKKQLGSPRVLEVNQLLDIVRPFASDMKLLKPSFTKNINPYVLFTVSFTLTVFLLWLRQHSICFPCLVTLVFTNQNGCF